MAGDVSCNVARMKVRIRNRPTRCGMVISISGFQRTWTSTRLSRRQLRDSYCDRRHLTRHMASTMLGTGTNWKQWNRMSSRLPTVKRFIASSALLIWCALAAVIPAADALAERASQGSRSHVEAVGGSASCTPVHDHLACQLCRLLRLPVKSGEAAALFALRDVARTARPEEPIVVAARERESGHLSRAPPSA